MPRHVPRRPALRRLVIAAAATALVVAATGATANAAGAPRCTVSSLLGELRRPSAGAGQRQARLVLTNVTRGSCSLGGFVGGQLLGARNRDLPTDVVRSTSRRAATIVLQPGQSAVTTLQWSVVAGTGDRTSGECQPTPARIEITPPNATQHLVLPWRNGPVCEQGRIVVAPLTRA